MGGAGLQFARGDVLPFRHILGKHRSPQARHRIVGYTDRFLFVWDTDNGRDGSDSSSS